MDASRGFFNDDEARIEAVLRTCSNEEISALQGTETLENVKGCLGSHDLATVNALTDLGDPNKPVSKEERLIKADAVRLAGAMDGCGTDEAKVKQILEGADTEEKRRLLRKHFNNYASELKQWEGGGGKDVG